MKVKNDIWSFLPTKLVDCLMPFQKEGVEFAIDKDGRCLIADEMGLGKTLQAISVAYYYRCEWPVLIIVPSSLKYCWVEEFEKWLPDIPPGEINMVQSGNDISGISTSKVTITTYGLLSKSTSTVLREALMSQGFRVVIVDESHSIRNIKTVSAKVIVPLIKNATRRILLSGTPALARPVELYPQIDAILPNEFGSWWAYTTRYCDAKTEFIGRMRRRNVNGASNLEELQQKLSSLLMIRRQKKDVLTQLPAKVRQKVLFDLKESDLKKEIKRTFEELRPLLKKRSEELEIVEGSGDTDDKDLTTLSMIQRLYQMSGEAKVGPAKEYMEMLCDNPNLKFLVFAYHKSMMNGLSQSLYDKNIKFIRIDGDTPPSERPQLVHQFQSDPDTRVAVLSILAAGVGLTFTAATLVVFAEMYWTPGMMVQCEDRAHRIGQTASVAVHYLVAKDTMDEWVWSAVCKKTIVTSTALTGKKQKMEAVAGDTYQVDVLSNAEVWQPSNNNESLDLTGYFQTQLAPDQKSIRDFFTSSQSSSQTSSQIGSKSPHASAGKSALSVTSSPLLNWLDGKDSGSPCGNPRKRAKLESESTSENNGCGRSETIVVIDSASDTEDFASESKSAKMSKKRKRSSKKGFGKCVSPKSTLEAAFKRVSRGDNSVIVSDEELEVKGDTSDVDKCISTPKHGQASVKNQWSCIACTFFNHPALTKCEMCDSPKKLSKMSSGDSKRCAARGANDETSGDVANDLTTDCNGKGVELEPVKTKTENSMKRDSKTSNNGINEDILKTCDVENITADDNADNEMQTTSMEDSLEECLNAESQVDVDEYSQMKSPMLNLSSLTQSPSGSIVSSSGKVYRFKSFKKSSNGNNTDTVESGSERKGKGGKEGGQSKTYQSCKKGSCGKRSVEIEIEGGSTGVSEDIQNMSDSEQETGPAADVANPRESSHEQEDTEEKNNVRQINLDEITLYKLFRYRCSKYTGRIYILDENDSPLNINFIPMDIEVGNHDNLPDVLLHPHHLRLVQKFVREWQSLTETKRRLIIKLDRSFISPLREYEDNKSCKTVNTQRHRTKIDTALAAMKKAAEVSGTLRVITPGNRNNDSQSAQPQADSEKGVTQVVTEDGTPLCVHCMKPYENQLLKKSTITDGENAWQTRFCSQTCAKEYWMVSNNDYMRDQVFEAEHGVCQMCKFDAHALFKQVRDTRDQKKRAELITKSKLRSLCVKVKEQMVKKPVAGQFWHADHIIPVWQGGGQCDIDNLRTLCVTCHHKVTAQQAGQRATVRRLGSGVKSGDITAFFQKQ